MVEGDPVPFEEFPFSELTEDVCPLPSFYMFTGLISEMVPSAFEIYKAAASKSKSDPDTYTFEEAMRDPKYVAEWKTAAMKEIQQFIEKGTFVEVPIEEVTSKVLPGVWVFKMKRRPDGTLLKFKARFCIQGNRAEKTGDENTYASVCQWSTVRFFVCLSLALGWITVSADFANAFLQATLPKPVFVHLPRGFVSTQPGKTVLKCLKSIYVMSESPRLWQEHLMKALYKLGFKSCKNDPCLLYRRGMMLLLYVDDLGIAAESQGEIDKFIADLRAMKFDLTVEESFCEFLGIKLERDNDKGTVTLTQPGLIKRIVEACGLVDCRQVWTPTTLDTLGSDPDGAPMAETWNYKSVIGMLLYLSNNTRPDLTFAVSQVARFTHAPKQSHAVAVKRIVRYLATTSNMGTIVKRSKNLNLDVFVDADFAGLYRSEPDASVSAAKSRTGIVIQVGGCTILCKSKLQTEVSLSTLEAEYSALSHSMRLLLPIRRLLLEMIEGLELPPSLANFETTVHEDNNGALLLATNQKITARTKYFLVKYHFFWDWVKKGDVKIVKVDTKEQIADIFTKGLPRETFEHLRRLLQGW